MVSEMSSCHVRIDIISVFQSGRKVGDEGLNYIFCGQSVFSEIKCAKYAKVYM